VETEQEGSLESRKEDPELLNRRQILQKMKEREPGYKKEGKSNQVT